MQRPSEFRKRFTAGEQKAAVLILTLFLLGLLGKKLHIDHVNKSTLSPQEIKALDHAVDQLP